MTYVVDRCYDRYIITLSRDPDCEIEEGGTLETLFNFIKDVFLSVVEDNLQTGRLKSCRIGEGDGEALCVDIEAGSGSEELIAGAVDAISTAMLTLSDRYPDDITVEI